MRTHHAIERAFVEMLSNHSPDDITVSSLTQHAGIHRKTFYLHFTSIDDVYEDYVQTLAHQYSEIIRDLPLPYDYYTLSRIMFDFYTQSEQVEKYLLIHVIVLLLINLLSIRRNQIDYDTIRIKILLRMSKSLLTLLLCILLLMFFAAGLFQERKYLESALYKF